MILVSQTYDAGSEERNAEIRGCAEFNSKSGVFESVEYLDGASRRLSFTDLVKHCEKRHRGRWCVVANSDIEFPTSANVLDHLKEERLLVTLTRWESQRGPRFIGHSHGDRLFSGSQDSWAFLAGGVPVPEQDIPLGIVGCDQLIAGWAVEAGIEVINPALSIRTYHRHATPPTGNRPSLGGFFAYPELTTLWTTGDVLAHHWPALSGEWRFEWQHLATRR